MAGLRDELLRYRERCDAQADGLQRQPSLRGRGRYRRNGFSGPGHLHQRGRPRHDLSLHRLGGRPDVSGGQLPGTQDLKRVIISVRLDTTAVAGPRHYQELQSQVSDPNATVAGQNPSNPTNATPWTFFLTDTPV